MVNLKGCIAVIIILLCYRTDALAQDQSYKNFFGISWRGKVHDNLLYARNMGYKYVFYQKGMENDSLSNGLFFYLESPEYSIYKRAINLKGTYTAKDISFYEKYCAVAQPQLPFPSNMATGWFFNDTIFSAELDFRKKEVIDWAVQEIFGNVKIIEDKNKKFKFAGFAWDVPQLTGDFWSPPTKKGGKGGRQVTLAYWKKNDNKSSDDRENQYIQGRIQYYQALFSTMKIKYPSAKTIMEPNRIYEDWIKYFDFHNVPNSIMPDILCQESGDWKFIDDARIFNKGLLKKDQLMATSPSIFGEDENRVIASQMAINGAWFSWYGRFGGTGNMPNYMNIYSVPDRLKLIRVLVNWENLNKTALNQRLLENGDYKSPTAGMSKNILWGTNPQTKDIYFIFLAPNAILENPFINTKTRIYELDSLMGKKKDRTGLFNINGKKISLSDSTYLGKSFLLKKFN